MTPTDTDKYIKITVRDNDFDVKVEGPMTFEEVYLVIVSLLQHMERDAEEFLDSPGSSMVH
jgi:precorrin-6B methylase 2